MNIREVYTKAEEYIKSKEEITANLDRTEESLARMFYLSCHSIARRCYELSRNVNDENPQDKTPGNLYNNLMLRLALFRNVLIDRFPQLEEGGIVK